MGRMDELWQAAGGPGLAPETDARAVKARVNAALDADPGERSIHMKQKLRYGLAVAALVAAVTTSALAVGANWDILSVFFQGDTAPAQNYVDATPRSVSDENYTLTVESAVSDETSACLLVTVKANNEATREFLFSDSFNGIDTFYIRAVNDVPETEGSGRVPWSAGGTSREHSKTEDAITYAMRSTFVPTTTALRVRVGYMAEGLYVEVPLDPAPTVKVDVNATGVGVPWLGDGTAGELTVKEVRLSPISCRIDAADPTGGKSDTHPRVLLRMADGTVRTQAQLMEFKESERTGMDPATYTFHYVLNEVLDLSQVKSVIVFDREYPLDGSAPKAIAHDAALDPFTVPLNDQLRSRLREGGGIPVPVRALTEGLGGTCEWDSATGAVTCTYRGVSVVLTPGSTAVTVDGEARELTEAPQARYVDGTWVTVAPWEVFEEAWRIDGLVTCILGEPIEFPDGHSGGPVDWQDWYVIP